MVNATKDSKGGLSTPVIIAVVLAAVILVCFIGYRLLAPKAYLQPGPAIVARDTTAEFIKQKVQETGGDYSKVSPQDQIFMQRLTTGKAPQRFKEIADTMKTQK